LTGGWIGRDDKFIITLPQNPGDRAADALADYYQTFPDFMGVPAQWPEHGSPVDVAGALPTGLGIPGGGPRSLLAFGGVVLRAIALSWQSPKFLAELTDETREDAAPVLGEWLGYNNPFNFLLQFKIDKEFRWITTRTSGSTHILPT
jgi:ribosomally synthesized peptide (two-chain TOMM family)